MKTLHWGSFLKKDTVQWLLEPENPSVRYFTLITLLDKSDESPETRAARSEVMKTGAVPRILGMQAPEGYWGKPEDFYVRAKYRGTVWQIIILASLGADGNDPRIKESFRFITTHSQDPKSGGFAYRSDSSSRGDHTRVLPCLTGNMVWSFLRFGYLEEPEVQKGISWIARYQRFDDGIKKPPAGWPYDRYAQCWGRHTCHMGAVKCLKALAEIPENKRSKDVRKIIDWGTEHLLQHHIFKKSHDTSSVAKESWLKFGFPLMWNTDALEMFGILTGLGVCERRMEGARDLVISKQDPQGRWILDSTFNGRFLFNIEKKGKQSKWITLLALKTLKEYCS